MRAVRQGVHLTFRCEYCRETHCHGAHTEPREVGCGCQMHANPYRGPCTCPPGSGDGHRVAHCWSPKSPYKQTGYFVREVAALVVFHEFESAGLFGPFVIECRPLGDQKLNCPDCAPGEVHDVEPPSWAESARLVVHQHTCPWMAARLPGAMGRSG